MTTVRELLEWGRKELADLGAEEAEASARVLLSEVLSLSRTSLYLEARREVPEKESRHYRTWIAGRKQRIPTAYLTGTAYFWNETLIVGPGCLVPRPETETLVKAFVDASGFSQTSAFTFADLGAGSGAIGIALLRHFEKARCVFLDCSEKALELAAKNVEKYALGERCRLVKTDLFGACGKDRWDALVSNPPYFKESDWAEADAEVLQEPREALDGGQDGLFFYRNIAESVSERLYPSAPFFLEVGRGQAPEVRDLLVRKNFTDIKIFKDDINVERVVMARAGSHG
ncbi:MAG: peptide chain release factor N(5)-glutamine methyltransferase [Candidatus Omnitrophica bacterium]|nr:peptide chain release factor N(5)-glutamine methyltransferase [Candidatus Omnitrophota bacterium]